MHVLLLSALICKWLIRIDMYILLPTSGNRFRCGWVRNQTATVHPFFIVPTMPNCSNSPGVFYVPCLYCISKWGQPPINHLRKFDHKIIFRQLSFSKGSTSSSAINSLSVCKPSSFSTTGWFFLNWVKQAAVYVIFVVVFTIFVIVVAHIFIVAFLVLKLNFLLLFMLWLR